jgi:hypothetical protein
VIVNKEGICSLESAISELRKEITLETEVQQDLLVKKCNAEAGMCGYKRQKIFGCQDYGLVGHDM